MIATSQKYKDLACRVFAPIVLLAISTMCFLWLSERDIFYENMQTYSPAEINAYDSSLFTQDIDVVTSENTISPRFCSITIVASLMKLGLSYEQVYLILHFLACIIAAIGGVVFVYFAKISNKLLGVLIYTVVIGLSRLHVFADFFVFTTNSIFIGLGGALGVLAVIMVLYNQTKLSVNVAYGLVALAAVCHIHEGIWSFVLVSFIYLFFTRTIIPYKIVSFYLAFLTLLALTIPSLLSGQYVLPTEDFFSIYVKERIPHHLLLSRIGWTPILTLVSTWSVVVYLNRESLNNNQLYFYLSLIALFFLTLGAWYGYTEVLHIPSLVKLYVAKFVKYLSIPFSLLFISYIDEIASNKGHRFILLSLLLCLFVKPEIWLFTLLLANFVAWLPIEKKYHIAAKSVFVIICLLLFVYDSTLTTLPPRSMILMGCSLAMIQLGLLKEIAYMLIIAGGLFGHIYHRTHSLSANAYINFCMKKQAGEDAYLISQKISEVVPKEQRILCEALSIEDGYIQHISRRSMYVLDKTVPSSDQGIKIWHDRIIETKDFCQWTPERTAEFMREKELQYVTINTQNMTHPYDDCSLFAKETEQGNFILYKLQ